MAFRRPSSLMLAVAVTVFIAIVLLLRLNQFPLEEIVVVPFVLFLPGYALTFAFFGGQFIGAFERLLLSVALSIAVAILTGVALNFTPIGLQSTSWLIALVLVTLCAAVYAFFRRQLPVTTSLRFNPSKVRAGNVFLYSLAVLLLVVTLLIVRLPTPAIGIEGYTSLWVLPIDASHPQFLRLGVGSSELTTDDYRLELQVNGQKVQEWNNIELKPGQNWSAVYDSGTDLRTVKLAELSLYRSDQPTVPYRQVHIQP